MTIAQLEKVMLNLLKSGYSVKLGDRESFSATVSSNGEVCISHPPVSAFPRFFSFILSILRRAS